MSHSSEPPSEPRLTTLSHGGGCGCKIPSATLADLLTRAGASISSEQRFPLLASSGKHFEDAAVWRCDDGSALVATTDFFTPIVDNAYDFGRIAAANALSDIYAMGARPLFALNVLAMPLDKVSDETVTSVLRGGAATCEAAGIPIAGGHSIRLSEPVYGLMAVGRGEQRYIRYNGAAQAGDVLVLGKPLGIGILAAAHQRGELDDEGYAELLLWATKLNSVGADLAAIPGVHAMTDISGFGLSGHLGEMCKSANLTARVDAKRVPMMEKAIEMAKRGIVPGATKGNMETVKMEGDAAMAPYWLNVFSDPQTNGGLLVACERAAQDAVLRAFHTGGYERAAVMGEFLVGDPRVELKS